MATQARVEGRKLHLTVEGFDGGDIVVEPLSAKRGRLMTEAFVRIATGELTSEAHAAQVFIDAIGPANYARLDDSMVDEFDPQTGEFVHSWGPEGPHEHPGGKPPKPQFKGARYRVREPIGDEPVTEAGLRQEETNALMLCAFYWQTVLGMEGVQTFLEAGEGTAASLKAMRLLQMRLGLSTFPNSSSVAMESAIRQQALSEETNGTGNLSSAERRPAKRPADHKSKQSKPRAKRG